MRDNFIFFKSYFQAIETLPPRQQLKMYKFIMEFMFNSCKSLEEVENFFEKSSEKLSENSQTFGILLAIKPFLLKSAKASLRGCLGGAPSGNKNAQKKQAKNKQIELEKEIELEEEYTNKEKENKKEKESFKNFWENCPKKIDEIKTYTAFITAINEKKATAEQLIQGIKNYSAFIRKENKDEKYIMSPFNWLCKGKWTDEYEGVTYEKKYNPFAI